MCSKKEYLFFSFLFCGKIIVRITNSEVPNQAAPHRVVKCGSAMSL